ncbi:Na+/H+ antiporter NhaA [Nocardia sp. CA2R105]|uniref:Na+/H+ antiporter NhaA n=1 Tax=Nocardia coffeae TaxID=2873381 RepID=UPI001CA6FCBC|nr:Na+/H+ antiporter NhaA [Nocardia coffeae]MBY8860898.1 Na+/H+ antiporter NhaA [Nocardia coffeae]
MPLRPTVPRQWLSSDSAPGVALLGATAAAMVWLNCAGHSYTTWWSIEWGPSGVGLHQDLRAWVDDALMTLFFFVIGLELKAELTRGRLRHPRQAIVPVVAAVGGAIVPAVLFLTLIRGGDAAAGWGVPMATDPAFALGVLALITRRTPGGVRTLLLAIATVDDALAVLVIAIGYAESVGWGWLACAAAGCLLVVGMRRAGISSIWPYVPVGVAVWFATFHSGVHATFAGVVLALLTPAGPVDGRHVLDDLLHVLTPISTFVVVPVFALVNAGVRLDAAALGAAAGSMVMWSVWASLLIGKFVGVAGSIAVTTASGLGRLPADVGAGHVIGLALTAGLGFTVSLLVAELAYTDSAMIEDAKIGVMAASLVAAIASAVALTLADRRIRI